MLKVAGVEEEEEEEDEWKRSSMEMRSLMALYKSFCRSVKGHDNCSSIYGGCVCTCARVRCV